MNAISYFSNDPFLVLNPDTIWNISYLKELLKMQKIFYEKKSKCILLVVKKQKSFSKVCVFPTNLHVFEHQPFLAIILDMEKTAKKIKSTIVVLDF